MKGEGSVDRELKKMGQQVEEPGADTSEATKTGLLKKMGKQAKESKAAKKKVVVQGPFPEPLDRLQVSWPDKHLLKGDVLKVGLESKKVVKQGVEPGADTSEDEERDEDFPGAIEAYNDLLRSSTT